MAGRVVGLDIGTSGVRAAELSLGRGGPALERFGQVALPLGAVRDGEVVDSDVVAVAIRELWSRTKLGSKKVVVGVANQKVVVRQVDLPWLPAGEMRSSLAYQVQDYIPMPVEQAILDFHPIEEVTADSGARMLRVLLVAASRDMVDGALSAVTKAGLVPTMVDLNSFAVLRALVDVDHLGLDGPEAEAIVDVGASVTNIVVHQSGVPRFVRILLMGGGDITDAIAERLGVPVEQAESIKHDSGLAGDPTAEPHPLSRAMAATGGAFVEEVRGSLDYYMAQTGAARIGRVVLSGGGSRLGGLVDSLSDATRLPVQPARPLSRVRTTRSGLNEDELALLEPLVTVPVGLALGVA